MVKLSLYEGRLSQIADVCEELRCVCKYHEMTDNYEMYKISGNTDLKNTQPVQSWSVLYVGTLVSELTDAFTLTGRRL